VIDLEQNIKPLVSGALSTEQMNRAKKTVTVTVEVDGQIYQKQEDASSGFMIFIDKGRTEKGYGLYETAMMSDFFLVRVAEHVEGKMKQVSPGTLFSIMMHLFKEKAS
jgi:hypothetical protein